MLKQINQIFSIKFITVLIISVPSAIITDYFNIPLAWFLGPMIITSIAALSGLKIIMPKIVLSFILIILGLHIGNYIDQNLFNQMINCCLLYTSPSPRDATLSRMPSSA